MGKIKLTARARILGNSATLLLMFAFSFFVIFVSGNLSVIGNLIMNFIMPDSYEKSAVIIILSFIGILFCLLILPPLKLGRERYFFMKAKKEPVNFRDLFFCFSRKDYLKSLFSRWYELLIKTGAFLLFIFPSVCLSAVTYFAAKETDAALAVVIILAVGSFVLLSVGLAYYFVFSQSFFLYNIIIINNDNIKPSKAYSYSNGICGKSKLLLCRFKLSFIPWWLLCVFVFPAFYVWGYYKQSMALLQYRNEYLNKTNR